MSDWIDKFKLGKSAFIKRDLRLLPLTEAEAEFEADFFLDRESSSKDQERWMGMVIERESDGVQAMEDVRLPPPTVNDLATLLARAMTRPPDYGDRQRPSTVYLRDRPQWQELIPHLQQLGIGVVSGDDLPRFDEAVIDWMQQTKRKKLPPVDEIQATLRKPFPERKRTLFTDAMDLMEWTAAMSKGAYPSRKVPVPSYGPMTVVSMQLTADELESILTKTEIAKTKKLRPQLETMAAEGKTIDLDINDWSRVLLALCETGVKEMPVRKSQLGMAKRIAHHLAEALGIEAPSS
ncbi:MAG: hypothetical protein H8E44_22625 [Planctomycetes bacterium]|nr:hypothetical protein [Planctomycetota bacterium]MBL7041478.1 hypothetical protein [Pirellulaceae bacterium]